MRKLIIVFNVLIFLTGCQKGIEHDSSFYQNFEESLVSSFETVLELDVSTVAGSTYFIVSISRDISYEESNDIFCVIHEYIVNNYESINGYLENEGNSLANVVIEFHNSNNETVKDVFTYTSVEPVLKDNLPTYSDWTVHVIRGRSGTSNFKMRNISVE